MEFTTLKYLAFVAAVAVSYRVAPPRYRPSVLAIASYWFYWLWSGTMAVLIFAATSVAFLSARWSQAAATESKKQWIAGFGVTSLVLLLVFFKTEPFWTTWTALSLLIPIGISYYTFKLISYLIDVSRGDTSAETNFVNFAAYVSFFPQIVAGPIQRSHSFLSQIRQSPNASWSQIFFGVQRILLGYFKKFVVADNLQLIVDHIYSHLAQPGTPVILGFWLYPVQLYADFSGLTDIANGSALLLGIEAPENFEAPFAAATIGEYWRRWHITLTSWLTDYVFNPLAIATRSLGNVGLVFSLVVNMVLIGIWHRIVWAFVIFGMLHAFYLAVDALTKKKRQRYYKGHRTANRVMTVMAPVFTYQLVAVGLVLFRARSIGEAFTLLGHLAWGLDGISPEFGVFLDIAGRGILLGAAGYTVAEVADYWRRQRRLGKLETPARWVRWAVYSSTAVTLLFVVLLLMSMGRSRNPFVYAIF